MDLYGHHNIIATLNECATPVAADAPKLKNSHQKSRWREGVSKSTEQTKRARVGSLVTSHDHVTSTWCERNRFQRASSLPLSFQQKVQTSPAE